MRGSLEEEEEEEGEGEESRLLMESRMEAKVPDRSSFRTSLASHLAAASLNIRTKQMHAL